MSNRAGITLIRSRPRTVVVALIAFAGTLLAGGAPATVVRARLTIAMQFEQTVSATSLHEMKSEFERIMRPAAANVEWRMLRDVAGNEVFHEIVVVRFQGSCEADGIKNDSLKPRFLGGTEDEDGELLPFSKVDCRELLAMLSLEPSVHAGSTFHVQLLLGRAMGRVLAHEVYHAVLKTARHGERGIAKSPFTGAELFGAELRFDVAQIDRLNAALSPVSLAPDKHSERRYTLESWRN